MSFGIVTYAADGSENFRGEHRTLRVVYHQSVSQHFTGVVLVPGITPANAIAYCIARTANPYVTYLNTSVEVGQVRITRFHNSYVANVVLDLIVLAIA